MRNCTLHQRFLSKILKHEDGCWYWQAYTNEDGYGIIGRDGRATGAHRVAYELYKGPIPEGLELDHLCKHRDCVNPAHLQAVTHKENVQRGESFSVKKRKQTHCIHGHPLSGYNLQIRKDGKGRQCKTCLRLKYKPKRKTREQQINYQPK